MAKYVTQFNSESYYIELKKLLKKLKYVITTDGVGKFYVDTLNKECTEFDSNAMFYGYIMKDDVKFIEPSDLVKLLSDSLPKEKADTVLPGSNVNSLFSFNTSSAKIQYEAKAKDKPDMLVVTGSPETLAFIKKILLTYEDCEVKSFCNSDS